MLHKVQNAQEKLGGKSDTIDNWLKARQALLLRFCSLAGVSPQSADKHHPGSKASDADRALPDISEIEAFCQDLLDYISAGHFEVYDMLVENDTRGQQLKAHIYPQISETTDRALRFNDRYTDLVDAQQAARFDNDIAALGQTLEERFELEDELLHHMHEKVTAQAVVSVDSE